LARWIVEYERRRGRRVTMDEALKEAELLKFFDQAVERDAERLARMTGLTKGEARLIILREVVRFLEEEEREMLRAIGVSDKELEKRGG